MVLLDTAFGGSPVVECWPAMGACQRCRTISHVIGHGTGRSTRNEPAGPA
jgi:hypothetical protein